MRQHIQNTTNWTGLYRLFSHIIQEEASLQSLTRCTGNKIKAATRPTRPRLPRNLTHLVQGSANFHVGQIPPTTFVFLLKYRWSGTGTQPHPFIHRMLRLLLPAAPRETTWPTMPQALLSSLWQKTFADSWHRSFLRAQVQDSCISKKVNTEQIC